MKEFLILCCLIPAVLIQKSLSSPIESLINCTTPYTFVLLGASGDLSKREIYPALWYLYRQKLLPPKTAICGYSLSSLTIDDLRKKVAPFVKIRPEEKQLYNKFWKINHYVNGSKDSNADYDKINSWIEQRERHGAGNRIFYMAIPPSVFASSASQIKRACMAKKGITRVVIEKPFGRDSESSKKLSDELKALFTEDQIYRMDHYLGVEMNQNLLALRFANKILGQTWNKDNIAAVKIDFKENFGVEGRGAYFDKYGIIRDVVQNHLLQVLSLVAIEKPKSINSNDIRDEKVKLLKKTKSIVLSDVVLGQYVGNPGSKDLRERKGYLDDPTVPKNSTTSTFSLTVLKINNKRWSGVPFIIRAGKGLAENKTEIIIQYKNSTCDLFDGQSERNQLIIKMVYDEEIELNIMSKIPGISQDLQKIKINFNYKKEYTNADVPKAYARLILNIFLGSQKNFVRTDELSEAWKIFTPVLHKIENKKIKPILYKYGSTGPKEADALEKKYNFL